MNFENKNVVITGGSTGIGLATAKAFLNAGANVMITARNAGNLKKAEEEISNSKLQTIVADTSGMQGIYDLEKAVVESGRKVDILFLNAAIAAFGPIEHASEADFDAQFSTNVKGHYFTLQKLIPHLSNGSSVIFTSSGVATAASIGTSIYSATKSAVNKIAQIAANELADRKIRVNVISPGPIQTPGLDSVATPEAKSHLAASTALQRLGTAEEIANAVLFLSSDAASFISGADLAVDGGGVVYMMK